MTVRVCHVLPCGISILHNLIERKVGGDPLAETYADLQNRARHELMLDRPVRDWADAFHHAVGPRLDALRDFQDPVALSAEAASLHKHEQQHGRLEDDDRVVLLASDTTDGLLAALLNAAWLRRPVRVHVEPKLDSSAVGEPLIEASAGHAGAQPVHVIRIPGLLPDNTARFTPAMQHVAQAMLWAGWLTRPRTVVLHLAGGYKATLPYLVVLAEYLKAACFSLHAYCLHEGEPGSAVRPEPVEIFLREVDRKADYEVIEQVAAGKNVSDSRLRDFAYRFDDRGKRKLTPIGMILRDMLSVMEDATC